MDSRRDPNSMLPNDIMKIIRDFGTSESNARMNRVSKQWNQAGWHERPEGLVHNIPADSCMRDLRSGNAAAHEFLCDRGGYTTCLPAASHAGLRRFCDISKPARCAHCNREGVGLRDFTETEGPYIRGHRVLVRGPYPGSWESENILTCHRPECIAWAKDIQERSFQEIQQKIDLGEGEDEDEDGAEMDYGYDYLDDM